MNPWDKKLTHQLNDNEMHDFIMHMIVEGVFERERQIKSMVEEALNQWTTNRGLPAWQRGGPFGPGRVSMTAPVDYQDLSNYAGHYIEFRLMLPEYLEHDQAAFLAEMQIREIFAQNE